MNPIKLTGIINVPQRAKIAERIKQEAFAFSDDVLIVTDNAMQGCTFNSARTIQRSLDKVNFGDWVFITTDDIKFCSNFTEHLKPILDIADNDGIDVVCLNYHYKKNIPENTSNELVYKARSKMDFSDIGFCIKKTQQTKDTAFLMLDTLLNNKAKRRSFMGGVSSHFDQQFGEFLISAKIEWFVVYKALVQHLQDIESSLGHNYKNAFDGFIDLEVANVKTN